MVNGKKNLFSILWKAIFFNLRLQKMSKSKTHTLEVQFLVLAVFLKIYRWS